MRKQQILSLLSRRPGQYVSGEEMSRALEISRAAVWKAIDGLRQEGYAISSTPNRGYRLDQSPDKLSPGALSALLPPGAVVGRELVVLEQVDSTNNEVKRRAAGSPEGLAVLAETQTAGKGRRGRTYSSPAGKGLYLSFLLRPELELAQVLPITAWTAVAVCNGVEAACGLRPGIKWTNDIILNGRKLCGILTELELEGESGGLGFVVVGAGINVSQTEADFGPELAPLAVSLAQATGRVIRRDKLAGHVLTALNEMYAAFPGERDRWLAQYRADCLTLGREVRLIRNGGEEHALALDVNEDFGLVVRHRDGRLETISSGEVSVRGLLGYV